MNSSCLLIILFFAVLFPGMVARFIEARWRAPAKATKPWPLFSFAVRRNCYIRPRMSHGAFRMPKRF
jgi:hypothetical protein